jgi:hypothetical protein
MSRWHDEQECRAPLNALLGEVLEGGVVRLPAKCGHCQSSAVHIYFHDHRRGRGGVWVWCSSCGCYLHGSAVVPSWWGNLAGVDEQRLTASPEYLEPLAHAVDAHWCALRPGSTPVTAASSRDHEGHGLRGITAALTEGRFTRMDRELRPYRAMIWGRDPAAVGTRTTVMACDLADARRKLEEQFGKDNMFYVYNEEGLDRSR